MNLYLSKVWKDVPGYEGIYQASNFGEIRTVEGKTTHSKRHGKRVWKSRVLKGRGDNLIPGRRVSLWKNGKPKDFLVARLVATTFLGVPPEGFTVNHKDGNKIRERIDVECRLRCFEKYCEQNNAFEKFEKVKALVELHLTKQKNLDKIHDKIVDMVRGLSEEEKEYIGLEYQEFCSKRLADHPTEKGGAE